jgi:hypothetical protein
MSEEMFWKGEFVCEACGHREPCEIKASPRAGQQSSTPAETRARNMLGFVPCPKCNAVRRSAFGLVAAVSAGYFAMMVVAGFVLKLIFGMMGLLVVETIASFVFLFVLLQTARAPGIARSRVVFPSRAAAS